MMCDGYGRKERILLLDKLFRLDDKPVLHHANIVRFSNCTIT